MFILIEIDRDWTVGIDWKKNVKGFRLGFIAVHLFIIKHKDFMGAVSENYHQEKLRRMNQ
ncbi:MAG: hypothetical protein P0Y55_11815 [Candidatus Cohnella colombiensis]|uniref:Uncharacterized protein n=1 Tax=Candidatus Cohnella colombiensis TaxID=3121368 RepID=A0AA95JEI2_9BACL|nr:MAG: hypothetical protein P0Y55_11815 [Cohnella sp.]